MKGKLLCSKIIDDIRNNLDYSASQEVITELINYRVLAGIEARKTNCLDSRNDNAYKVFLVWKVN